MDSSDSLGELPLSRLCSPNRTSASCPSLPRYQAACVSILCGSPRAVARITCAAGSGGGTRERISLRPPDPHSPWHDAITQQSARFTGDPEVTELLPVCRRSGIYYKKHPHHRPGSSRHDEDTEILLNPKRVSSTILSSKVVSMAKPAPITIPTEPIGSIPRPVDLIERIAKGDREDPRLAPLYDEAISRYHRAV